MRKVSHDVDYNSRLVHLAELMVCHPDSKMKSLHASALREYPVHSLELHRHCMSAKFAMKAADIANHNLLDDEEDYEHPHKRMLYKNNR